MNRAIAYKKGLILILPGERVPAHFRGGGRDNTQIIPATRNHGNQHDGKDQYALAN